MHLVVAGYIHIDNKNEIFSPPLLYILYMYHAPAEMADLFYTNYTSALFGYFSPRENSTNPPNDSIKFFELHMTTTRARSFPGENPFWGFCIIIITKCDHHDAANLNVPRDSSNPRHAFSILQYCSDSFEVRILYTYITARTKRHSLVAHNIFDL